MGKPVRVLHILSNLGMGGIETMVMNFYRHMDRKRVQFDFLVFRREGNLFAEEARGLGGHIYYCDLPDNKALQLVRACGSVSRLIRRRGYKIVHIHGCSFIALLRGAVPARLGGARHIIVHGHNPGTPKNTFADDCLRGILKKAVCAAANHYFACSRQVAESKFTRSVVEGQKYELIRNGICLEQFRFDRQARRNYRKEKGLEDRFVIGNVGRLESQKNQKFLLEVFAQAHRLNGRAVLLLAGSGSLAPELREKAAALGVESSVLFLGMVREPSVCYQAMDVYVSTSFYEGLSVTLVEAQTAGLPCIVSSCSAEAQILDSFQVLSLEEPAERWAAAVQTAGRDDRGEKWRQVQDAGFDIDRETERIQRMYEAWRED